MKVALTGPVQLELLERYFREAGFDIAAPGDVADVIYDVTSHDEVLAREVAGFYDERFQKLAGCPYSLDGIHTIIDEFRWQLSAGVFKVLAVDADNTLWKGILSEDGKDALVPMDEFQKGLKALADDGVVLVLLSKNDPGSIDFDWFAVKKVNWEPKAGNLIEACRELNLGTDSVVFLDDNPYERAQMSAHLPKVMVAPWSGWGETAGLDAQKQLIRRLREYCFADAGKTVEDKLRSADYLRRGKCAAETFASKEDYLKSLDLHVEARPAEARDLDRLAQMAGKTNQFNCTTIRRVREEFEQLLSSVFIFSAGDKFGEQGIVCYVVVDSAKKRITDFVMSCRAMGRTLEYFAYDWVAKRLGYNPAVDFVPTAKNAPAAEFVSALAANAPRTTFYRSVLV